MRPRIGVSVEVEVVERELDADRLAVVALGVPPPLQALDAVAVVRAGEDVVRVVVAVVLDELLLVDLERRPSMSSCRRTAGSARSMSRWTREPNFIWNVVCGSRPSTDSRTYRSGHSS